MLGLLLLAQIRSDHFRVVTDLRRCATGDHPAVHLVPAEDPAALAATIIEKCRMLARAPTKSAAAAAWRAKFAVQKSADEYGAMLTGRISEQRRSG